jgi:NitT/TauT family transport system permease protein
MRYLKPLQEIPRGLYLALMVGSIGLLLLLWFLLSHWRVIDPLFLPSPKSVWRTMLEMFADGSLVEHTLASLKIVVLGWALGAIAAIPIGIAMGAFRFIEAILEPPIDFIRYLPVSALIPLLIIYVGIDDTARITVIFIGTFFSLVLMIADVAAQLPREMLDSAYTLGTRGTRVITRVLLPASFPGIMDNLRLTMGFAWSYLVVAEIIAAERGLGFMILDSMRGLFVSRMFVGLIVIGVLGFALDQLFRWLHRWLLPWAPNNT